MRIYERISPTLIAAEEEQLTLHLSEPHFTLWQKITKKVRLLGFFIKSLFLG